MEIPKKIRNLPESPKGLYRWILSDVVKNTYIVYNRKKNKCFCTRCGNVFDFDACDIVPSHNEQCDCPSCDCLATYKAEGRGRAGLTELTRILDFVRRGRTVYGVLMDIDIGFEGRMPEISKRVAAVYVFNRKSQLYFKYHPGWYYGSERWEQPKKVNVPAVPRGSFYYPPKREGLHVYTDNFNIFEKTDLKYADIPDFFERMEMTGEELVRYMDLSLKYQSIELLRKSGFEQLVIRKIDEQSSRCINWRAKDIRSILKLDMKEIRVFRDKGLTPYALETYQKYKKQGMTFSLDEIDLIISMPIYGQTESVLSDRVGLEKSVKYIAAQNKEFGRYNSVRDYVDYLDDCEALGLDLRRKKILFPINLYEEHMRLVDLRMSMENKETDENIRKQVEKLGQLRKPFSHKGLVIVPAESSGQLAKESSVLGHCVKRYADGLAKGQFSIFFIRKIEEQDKPFYTLELKKNKVTQCRGEENCNMTEEIKEFVEAWLSKVVNAKPKKRKGVA